MLDKTLGNALWEAIWISRGFCCCCCFELRLPKDAQLYSSFTGNPGILSQPVPAICIFIRLLCLTDLFLGLFCLLWNVFSLLKGRKEIGTRSWCEGGRGLLVQKGRQWGETGRKAEFHVGVRPRRGDSDGKCFRITQILIQIRCHIRQARIKSN